VFDEKGMDFDTSNLGLLIRGKLDHIENETAFQLRASRKEILERRLESIGDTRWTGDGQPPPARGKEYGGSNDENEPAEVVPMEMAYEDSIDRIGIDAKVFERRQGCSPTIDEKTQLRAIYQETCVETPAAAKGITTTYEL
jgi:hypothetical protein